MKEFFFSKIFKFFGKFFYLKRISKIIDFFGNFFYSENERNEKLFLLKKLEILFERMKIFEGWEN